MNSPTILNFHWHLLGRLATGSKPSTIGLIDHLNGMGFRAILSLEPVGESVVEHIKRLGIKHLVLPTEDDSEVRFDATLVDEEFWKTFRDFVDRALDARTPLFIHCSAGICRSVRLTERYLGK